MKPNRLDLYDVVIVGGGPAGLSAALILGRCLRKVLLCDDGHYRNAYSHAMHGFLSRDGIDPAELRRISREQLTRYETIKIQNICVISAACQHNEFALVLEDGQQVYCRKLLLATGIRDEWPQIKGAKEMYGRSIFHCPYCDAWELRNQPFAVYGKEDKKGGELALELTLWTKDIILCTDGPAELSEDYRQRLARHEILIREEPILQLEGKDGILERIIFQNGESLIRRALFFNTQSPQRSNLPHMLGCTFTENGGVQIGKFESTNIPGLFVAGDTSREILQAIVAAAEGVEAAMAINTSLLKSDLE